MHKFVVQNGNLRYIDDMIVRSLNRDPSFAEWESVEVCPRYSSNAVLVLGVSNMGYRRTIMTNHTYKCMVYAPICVVGPKDVTYAEKLLYDMLFDAPNDVCSRLRQFYAKEIAEIIIVPKGSDDYIANISRTSDKPEEMFINLQQTSDLERHSPHSRLMVSEIFTDYLESSFGLEMPDPCWGSQRNMVSAIARHSKLKEVRQVNLVNTGPYQRYLGAKRTKRSDLSLFEMQELNSIRNLVNLLSKGLEIPEHPFRDISDANFIHAIRQCAMKIFRKYPDYYKPRSVLRLLDNGQNKYQPWPYYMPPGAERHYENFSATDEIPDYSCMNKTLKYYARVYGF